MFRRLRRTELILFLALLGLLAASVCYAIPGDKIIKRGTAADFVATFPWLVVSVFGFMASIIIFFIVRTGREFNYEVRKTSKGLSQANRDLKEAVTKIDATINTLFDRDRDIDQRLAANRADIATQAAICRTHRDNCPGGCLRNKKTETEKNG